MYLVGPSSKYSQICIRGSCDVGTYSHLGANFRKYILHAFVLFHHSLWMCQLFEIDCCLT